MSLTERRPSMNRTRAMSNPRPTASICARDTSWETAERGIVSFPKASDRPLKTLTSASRLAVLGSTDVGFGLPDGESVDLVLCYLFRDFRLDRAMVDRLVPGGLLAVAVRSEVDVGPEEFPDRSQRARPGELRDAFGHLEVLDEGEGDGMARIVTRKPG